MNLSVKQTEPVVYLETPEIRGDAARESKVVRGFAFKGTSGKRLTYRRTKHNEKR